MQQAEKGHRNQLLVRNDQKVARFQIKQNVCVTFAPTFLPLHAPTAIFGRTSMWNSVP